MKTTIKYALFSVVSLSIAVALYNLAFLPNAFITGESALLGSGVMAICAVICVSFIFLPSLRILSESGIGALLVMLSNRRPIITSAAFSYTIALVIWHFLPVNQMCIDRAQGNLTGHALESAFQNRMLGPVVVNIISRITGRSFDTVCVESQFVLLIATIVIWIRFSKLAVFPFILLVVLLGSRQMYIWDYIDLVIMSLFAIALYDKRSIKYLAILCLAELTNRESAAFIALAIFTIGAITKDRKAVLVGIALMALCVVYVHISRSFYIGSGRAEDIAGSGQLFELRNNIGLALHHFGNSWLAISVLSGSVLTAIASVFRKEWVTAVTLLAMIAALMTFAVLNENRVYLEFVPFLVIALVRCVGARRWREVRSPSSY